MFRSRSRSNAAARQAGSNDPWCRAPVSAPAAALSSPSSLREALTPILGDTKKYKILITDVRLQGALYGWDVARYVREKEPAFPVIYVTGSNFEEWASQAVPDSILISKPFGRVQLIRAVSNLLNNGTSRTTRWLTMSPLSNSSGRWFPTGPSLKPQKG